MFGPDAPGAADGHGGAVVLGGGQVFHGAKSFGAGVHDFGDGVQLDFGRSAGDVNVAIIFLGVDLAHGLDSEVSIDGDAVGELVDEVFFEDDDDLAVGGSGAEKQKGEDQKQREFCGTGKAFGEHGTPQGRNVAESVAGFALMSRSNAMTVSGGADNNHLLSKAKNVVHFKEAPF